MTAWTAIVFPICILAKCGVDFIGMEYGSEFQFVSDTHLAWFLGATCVFALCVDFFNFLGYSNRRK